MGSHLTVGQRALLEAELQQRQRVLDGRLGGQSGGESRAAHAHEVPAQDAREAAQREGEREIDVALSELEMRELGEVAQALLRLREGRYGRCGRCGADIPFERLQAEPQALRCVACEAQLEAARRRGA
jgi:DnaK suppressor protein